MHSEGMHEARWRGARLGGWAMHAATLAILMMTMGPAREVRAADTPSAVTGSSSSSTYTSLQKAADYFHFQDALFGPTVNEMSRFCVKVIALWEEEEEAAALSSQATASSLLPRGANRRRLMSAENGDEGTASTTAAVRSSSADQQQQTAALRDARRAEMQSLCESRGTLGLFAGLAGRASDPTSSAYAGGGGGGGGGPSASAPTTATHGTLVFRLLPGVTWKGAALAPSPTPMASPLDPTLTLATSVSGANTLGRAGRGSRAIVDADIYQWAAFNANASSTSSSSAAALDGRVAVNPAADPSRHLLGASLAVLCTPSGYVAREAGSTASVVITSAALESGAACGIGDYRLSALLGTNASTSSSPSSSTSSFTTPPFLFNASSAAVDATMRSLLADMFQQRLRGSVFSVGWDLGVGVQTFGDVGWRSLNSSNASSASAASPWAGGASASSSEDDAEATTISSDPFYDTSLEDAMLCPRPSDKAPSSPIPSPIAENNSQTAAGAVTVTGFNGGFRALSNTYQRDYIDATSTPRSDCRRLAHRVGVVLAGGNTTVSAGSGAGGGTTTLTVATVAFQVDIVAADTVVACEPLAAEFRATMHMRPVDASGRGQMLELLRPNRPVRVAERTCAASSFAFGSSATTELYSSPSSTSGTPLDSDGWSSADVDTPQSIFASNYVLSSPFAYAELSPTRRSIRGNTTAVTALNTSKTSDGRSPRQRGTRLFVEDSVSGAASPLVGLVGLSPTPSCQTSSAAAAYYPAQGILTVSRNLTTLAKFLSENLLIFGGLEASSSSASASTARYGYRLDLSSNFGAPMTSANPLSPTLAADGTNDPNIAWFDVNPPFMSVAGDAGGVDGGTGAAPSKDPNIAAAEEMTSRLLPNALYPYPTFTASAIGTCPSGRRVISEQLDIPDGEPRGESVTVIVAAPSFGPLIISSAILVGMRAWTNMTCYVPSINNAADVAAIGGTAAFEYATSVNEWSSNPLTGRAGVSAVTYVLCHTRTWDKRTGPGGAGGDGSDSRAGVNGYYYGAADGDSASAAPPPAALPLADRTLFPSFTIHPESPAGQGTYPSDPSYLKATSSAFYSSLEGRSMKIRLNRMARPHAKHGAVVPMYIADTEAGVMDPTGEAFVVLGSAALTDFLVLSDSNAGRIGFAPAVSKASAESARLTPRFTMLTSPPLLDDDDASATIMSPSVGSATPDGGARNALLEYQLDPYPGDGDSAFDCAVPVPCADNLIRVAILNVCVDPMCGSWITRFNYDTFTCEYNYGVLAVMVLVAVMCAGAEMVVFFLFSWQYGVIKAQQGKKVGKKEV